MSENELIEAERQEQSQDGEQAETPLVSERERETNAIDAINSSSRYESRVNMARYEAQNVMEGMRNAPRWGVILGIACFCFLAVDLIMATILLINRIFVGAIVCAALFAGIIITAFIATAISRAVATNGDIRKAKKITDGKVKACFMSGTTTSKSGTGVRINGVDYAVLVVVDGEEYTAYTKRFYEKGEKVTVAVMSKRRAKIVEQDELTETTEVNEEIRSDE